MIVEFGASHGISTIYLAAGASDCDSGTVITTEIVPDKVQATRENLQRAGLAGRVEIMDDEGVVRGPPSGACF